MTAPTESETIKAVTDAVAKPGGPDQAAVVAKPERFPVWALALGGPAISAIIVLIILFVGSPRWRMGLPIWPDEVAGSRIDGLVWIAMTLAAILGLIVFRLASGGLRRIEARAGPGSLTLETGEPTPGRDAEPPPEYEDHGGRRRR